MAQQATNQQPQWNVSVRNTFIVVHDGDLDGAAMGGSRGRSCPPVMSPSSKSVEEQYASVPVCCEPQPADQLPARKGYPASGERAPTTMMIRNIPCCCSKDDVIGDIDSLGYAGAYDFFYLPRHRKSNLGYAFINFTHSDVAHDFRMRMQGHRFSSRTQFGGSNSTKACTITPAVVQGLTANKKHFRRTRVIKSERGPSFFQKQDALMNQDEFSPVQRTEASPARKDAHYAFPNNKFQVEESYGGMVSFHNIDALYGA